MPRELQICQQEPEEDEQKSIQRDYTLGLMSAELVGFVIEVKSGRFRTAATAIAKKTPNMSTGT